VLNDAHLSLIRLKQQRAGLPAQGTAFRAPRFDRVAEGFGAQGVRVETPAAFAIELARAIHLRRFTVIEAMVDPAEYLEQI